MVIHLYDVLPGQSAVWGNVSLGGVGDKCIWWHESIYGGTQMGEDTALSSRYAPPPRANTSPSVRLCPLHEYLRKKKYERKS